MEIKSICVFCGSSLGANSEYSEQAEKLGKYLAENKITLIYGGGSIGIMGRISQAVMNNGGKVIGVIPELINDKVEHDNITETIVTKDMHSRKKKMYDLSDAFIALPGGIGTIEEISEIFTWQQIGYHAKAVGLLNINSYYDKFLSFLDNVVSNGFMKDIHRQRLLCSNNIENLFSLINNFDGMTISKWS
ncbi:MAG: TIGR00730 family Rossman fold protein [Spirochaetales bacterium]|nr:TIGR00730 family Rossman fold protein [Spirochaetales bacterium]